MKIQKVYGIMRVRAGDWTTGQIDSQYSPQMIKEFYDYLRNCRMLNYLCPVAN